MFLPADIKSWMAMTFRGLEFCHRNFILHRVYHILIAFLHILSTSSKQVVNLFFLGLETQQLASRFRRTT